MISIEHEIVRRYLAVFGSTLRARRGSDAGGAPRRFLYVDAFATSAAEPAGAAGAGIGSAQAGVVRGLDALRKAAGPKPSEVAIRAAFLEQDPVQAERIHEALAAEGWGGRTQRSTDTAVLTEAGDFDITILETDLPTAAPALRALTESSRQALFRISPSSPREAPLDVLRILGGSDRADLIVRLPFAGLHRHERFRRTPVADLPPYVRRIAEGYSALFGDTRFEWISLWRAAEAEGGRAAAEARLCEHYRSRLTEACPASLVRAFRIPLSDGATSAVLHFFLVTGEPERVLSLNRILFDLRNTGHLPWGERPAGPVHLETPGLLELFSPASGETSTEVPQSMLQARSVDFTALAHTLAIRFAGETVPLREVMQSVVDTDLFPDDVRHALRLLRRDDRVSYRSLALGDARIAFRDRFSRAGSTGPLRWETDGLPLW